VCALTQFMQQCSYVTGIFRSLHALIHALQMPLVKEKPPVLAIIWYTLTLEAADSTDQSSLSRNC